MKTFFYYFLLRYNFVEFSNNAIQSSDLGHPDRCVAIPVPGMQESESVSIANG